MPRSERPSIGAEDEENPEIPALHNKILQSIHYEICVQGQVSNQWFDNFDGLVVQVLENDKTLIRADLIDKSALHGLLTRIGELNLTILSIAKIEESFGPNGT